VSRHPSHDDLAAYSLGALDASEERSVGEHLEGCAPCMTELRERLNPAIGVLAESVEQLRPPETLRRELMAAVHGEAARDGAVEPQPERSRIGALLMRPAAGIAVIALGAAAVAGYMVAEGDGGPSAETIPVQSSTGATGTLVVEDGSATLNMRGMEPLERGAVYQVWVADSAGVSPSATFVPHADGTATAAVPEAAAGADEVMVTKEPMPGRRTPTLPPLVDLNLG
jgi:Anti-sigma-K factor rskA, C-terminal